jgi:ribosome biogenesis GTPase / thiamine phosphate phosphatase
MPTEPTWGLVTRAIGAAFDVQVATKTLSCNVTGNLRKDAGRISSPVVVGDQVLVEELPDGTGLIRAVAPRLSEFRRVRARKPPQVVAANIDQALVAVAAAEPAPNFALVDRFLLAVRVAGLPVHLVVTKSDLLGPEVREAFGIYERAGFSVLFTSSVTGEGLEAVRALVKDQVSLITGTSGVGKSSLLNALEPGLGLQVGQVSEATGKGKHTTRDFRLIPLAEGGWIADTPGMRDFYVWDVPREMVYLGFPELEPYLGLCRFANCGHTGEPGCAIARAAAEHVIHPWRLASFLDIYRSAPAAADGRQRSAVSG